MSSGFDVAGQGAAAKKAAIPITKAINKTNSEGLTYVQKAKYLVEHGYTTATEAAELNRMRQAGDWEGIQAWSEKKYKAVVAARDAGQKNLDAAENETLNAPVDPSTIPGNTGGNTVVPKIKLSVGPKEKAKRERAAKKKADRATRIANAKPSTRKKDIEECTKHAQTSAGHGQLRAVYDKCLKEKTVKRQDRAARAARKKKKAEEIRLEGFDEQAFLLDHLDLIANTKSASGPSSIRKGDKVVETPLHNYRNFLQIEDDDPRITMNKLVGLGLDALNDLTTPQLSSLIPQIRLFKQVSDGNKTTTLEFPFNKFTTLRSIRESSEGRGTDVGLVKVSWKDTGGQPWTTGKSFNGSMVLNFQSVEAIFKDRGGISFADLMELQDKTHDPADLLGRNKKKTEATHKGIKLNEKEQANRVAEALKNNQRATKLEKPEIFGLCSDKYSKIILDVGWSIPEGSALNLSTTKNKQASIADQLSNMRRRYILYIFKHEIAVTENGHIDLTLDFTAAIEGMALTTQSDILNIDETNFWKLPSDIQQLIVDREEKQKEQGALDVAKEKEEAKAKKENRSVNKKFMANQRKRRKKLEKELEQNKSDLDTLAYRKLFTHMHKTIIVGQGRHGENRVFWFDLTPADINLYTQLLEIQAQKWTVEPHSTLEEEKKVIDDYISKVQEIKEKISQEGSPWTGDSPYMQYLVKGSTKEKDNVKKIKALVKAGKAAKTAQGYSFKKDGNTRIQYVFLGDIIEAVMSIIYEPRNMIGNKMTAVKGKRCKFLKKGLKLMVGSIRIIDPWKPDKERIMAISDIPVSLNYFKAWWYDNAVGKHRKHYTLLPFLKDLCGKLISNVMAPERYGGKPGYQLMFMTVPIVLKDGNPFDKEWDKSGMRAVKERVNIKKKLPCGRQAKTTGKQNEYSEWLYIYANGGPKHVRGKSQWQPLGFYNENKKSTTVGDKCVNIPHFVVGADKGIVKNIKFNRTKIPLQLEMALEQRSKGQSDKNPRANLLFQSFYNADLSLVGNPAFKIGQWIYIDPRAMGISPELNYNEWNSADLNVGGYYEINGVNNRYGDGEFITDLKCIQTIGMMQIRKLRKQANGTATN